MKEIPSAEESLRLSKLDDQIDSYSNKEIDYYLGLTNDDLLEINDRYILHKINKCFYLKERKLWDLRDLVSTACYDYIEEVEGINMKTIDVVDYLTIIATKYPQTVKEEYLYIIPHMIWLNMIGKKEACEVYAPLFCQKIDPYTEFLKRKEEKKNKVYNEDFDELELIIKSVIDNNSDKVKEFKKGKKGLIGFFIKEAKKINNSFDPKHLQDFFLNRLI